MSLFKNMKYAILILCIILLESNTYICQETPTEAQQETSTEAQQETPTEAQQETKAEDSEMPSINPEDVEGVEGFDNEKIQELLEQMKSGQNQQQGEDSLNNLNPEKTEEELLEETIKQLEFDKKEKITRQDFKHFIETLMLKDLGTEKNQEEEEFIAFLVEKGTEAFPEEETLEGFKEFMMSDKLKKILDEAVNEKFGINFNDIAGQMGGDGEEEEEGEGSEEEENTDNKDNESSGITPEDIAKTESINEQADQLKDDTLTNERPQTEDAKTEDL